MKEGEESFRLATNCVPVTGQKQLKNASLVYPKMCAQN
jgi:hypothetical protein